MSYLVRKITPSFWPDWVNYSIASVDELSGDAVTTDLKTSNNTLSLWEIESLDELRDISIAIAMTRDEVVNFLVVAIPKDEFENDIPIENIPNNTTAYVKYRSRHYDLVNLKFGSIKFFAQLVMSALKDKSRTFNFVPLDNKSRIKQYANQNCFDVDLLKQKKKLYRYIMDS